MKEAVIVSGSRTAIGTFGGGLKEVPVTELGAVAMKDVIKRVNLKPVSNAVMQDAARTGLKIRALQSLRFGSKGDCAGRLRHHAGSGGRDSGRRAGKYESGSNGITQGPLGSPDGVDRRW